MPVQVTGIVVLDSDGQRIAAKYHPTVWQRNKRLLVDFASQHSFEQQLMTKSARMAGRSDVEVLLEDDCLVLFRAVNDVVIFIIGDSCESEHILLEVMNAVFQSIHTLTNGQIGKRQLTEQLETTFLVLDEAVDNGIVFELDPSVIIHRVHMNEGEVSDTSGFNQAISSAKDNIIRSFLSAS